MTPLDLGDGSVPTYWGVDTIDAAYSAWIAAGARDVDGIEDAGNLLLAEVRTPFAHAIGLVENRVFSPPLATAKADDLSATSIVRTETIGLSPDDAFSAWSVRETLHPFNPTPTTAAI